MAGTRFDIVVAVQGAGAASAAIAGVRNSFDGIRTAVQGVAGLAAFGVVKGYLTEAWKASEEARTSVWQLEQALTASGQATKENSAALEAQAGALQSVTGTTDESVREVQRILVSMGGTVEQVRTLTPLTLDLAAAMGMDAAGAAKQLGKALDGGEVSLGRLAIKAKSFDDLIAQLNGRVKGQAEAFFQARGAAAALDVQLGEVSESVGHLLTWSATPFISEITRAAKALAEFLATPVGDRTKGFASALLNASPTLSSFRAMAGLAEAGARMAAPPAPVTPPAPQAAPGAAPAPLAGPTAPDEEETAIAQETERRAAAAGALLKAESEISGQFEFRRRLVMQDPETGEAEKRREFVQVLREELPFRQEVEDLKRAEYERALSVDPNGSLETTLALERELGEAQLSRLEVSQQIKDLEDSETYFGALSDGIQSVADQWGNLSVNLANGTIATVTNMVQGLAGALTSVVMGTQSAGAAFRQFGINLLTNFVSMILTAVLWAEVAIPILTALGVVSGGSTAATGAGITTAALAMGAAAAAGAVAREDGGIVPGGEQLVRLNERGQEFVVNAEATRRFLPQLEAMNSGEVPPAAGGASPVAGSPAAQAAARPAPAPEPARETRQNLHVYIDRRAWLDAVRDDVEGIAVDAMRRES